jgi:hypothetical protein
LVLILAALVALALAASAVGASGGGALGSGVQRRHVSALYRGTLRADPLAGRAMWIWVLGASDAGNLGSIVAEARQYGVATVMIKSGDGSSAWSQFNAPLVAALHARGLRVCAWQYVYGNHPIDEAYVGAAAVRDGADCLLIDAESEYEGKYVQAQSYMQRLRSLIGAGFPVALAGFPYVDYHGAFPYSVFLGPGGAQYNAPQMYWREIGTTVDDVFAHTFVFNRIYQRPIFPLGQLYDNPPGRQIRRFRLLSRAYGTAGVSWWDWQEARTCAWSAIAQAVGSLSGFAPDMSYATLGSGALGDLVVWAQEHLVSAGEPTAIDGSFGPNTLAAVQAFQIEHGLAASGLIDTSTWQALLRYPPAHVRWVIRHNQLTASTASAAMVLVPKSASLRARRYEIPRSFGAGRPGKQP